MILIRFTIGFSYYHPVGFPRIRFLSSLIVHDAIIVYVTIAMTAGSVRDIIRLRIGYVR
jgi:hypothetical protein